MAGVIKPAYAVWVSSIELNPEKDGTLFFCVVYLPLKAEIKLGDFPLPQIDDSIDSKGQAQTFSALKT